MANGKGFALEKGYKRAVLLFHGLTGSPFEMRQYAKLLHNSGFDVHCSTLPGHSGTIDELFQVTWRDWLNYAKEESARLKNNYEELYLSGLCMGAVLAMAATLENDKVSGVAALSTTLYLDGWTMPWYSFLLPLALYTPLRYFYYFPEEEPYGVKNEAIRKKISALYKQNAAGFDCIPLPSIYHLMRLSDFMLKRVKQLQVPTIIIHSKFDDLTSIKGAKIIYDKCSSQTKDFVQLENSYHMITIDNEKEFVANKVIEFFNKISKLTDLNVNDESQLVLN